MQEKTQNNSEIPIPYNQTQPDVNLTILDKSINAWKMLMKQGFGALFYKISRILYHKYEDTLRSILNPQSGKKFRVEAMEAFKTGKKLPTLSMIITVMGQHDLTMLCLNKIYKYHAGEIEIVIMDGKGDFKIEEGELPVDKDISLRIVHDKEAYPAFKYWMDNTKGDIMIFIHNDIIIEDPAFDITLRYSFYKYPKLGVVGFLGSDEMNWRGSRHWGTISNFLGNTYAFNGNTWKGKHAFSYGRKYDGLYSAVVVDGSSMAFLRVGWEKLPEPKMPPIPYYDYDRIMSLKYQEVGYRVAMLGIACDHISNMTAANEMKWHDNVKQIGEKNKIKAVTDSTGKTNWDISLHAESKRLFLKEYREEKNMLPRRVDWKV